MQNQDLKLNVVDGKIQPFIKINTNPDFSILESIPQLQIALGYNKPTKFYNFLFYDDKNLNYYKDKINKVKEDNLAPRRWISSNSELIALKSLGYTNRRIIFPAFFLSLLMTFITFNFNDSLVPISNRVAENIMRSSLG